MPPTPPPPDFAELFDAAPGPQIVLAPDLTIAAANQAYCRVTMTRREQLVGRALFDAFPINPDDHAADGRRQIEASLGRVLATAAADTLAMLKYDIRRPDADGGGYEERYWSLVSTPLLHAAPGGGVRWIVHRVEDVTDYVRLRRAQLEQLKVNEELLARAGQAEAEIARRAAELQAANDDLRRSEAQSRVLAAKLGFLDELAEATRELVDPVEVMAVITRKLGLHLGVSRCAYADVEPDSDRFTIPQDYTADGCASTAGEYHLSLFGPRAAADQRGGRTLVVHDVDRELAPGDGGGMFNAIGIKAIVCCPLIKDGRLAAMMAVHQTVPRRWSADEVALVEAVVERSWAYIERARATQQYQRAEAERERLLDAERAARAEAEHASRMKDEFLATLSHELRTPLNAILGWAHLLRADDLPPDELAEGLDIISRNARVQTQLIEDLLDMSRIVSGKVRLDVQAVDLMQIVDAALDTVRPAAEAKGIRLEKVLDPIAGPVRGDPGRLQQVAWNLLSNAIKFTPRGGKVQVVLERVNSQLELSVTDTGQGIRPEFLPHVFERFRQGDASTTRRHGGLGLGLSIVKHLVEMHGGTVAVHSGGEDRGATFTVSLPLSVAHLQAHRPADDGDRRHPRSPATSADDCESLAGVRVLVVDDDPDGRAIVKRILEDCEAGVGVAASAREAIEALDAGAFDVLVSDIGMPDEDGYHLIRQVRALASERNRTIPAAALTAFARSEDRKRALRSGYQTHLAKPVEPSELVAVIASLAGRSGKAVSAQ
jgi:signal transduction histidine kinase/CheY-like chemotaxis protein